MKSCLILSYGPVPTPQHSTVEGGGLRCWGLAQGLTRNGVEVTVAVSEGYPQEMAEYEGVKLKNWSLRDPRRFEDLINSYDAVLVSYCMGDLSEAVVNHIGGDVQLILDAYVPIYIEVSARESEDTEGEYKSFMSEVRRWDKVLKRGDYLLCANEAQKIMYTGVLSALGRINPLTYGGTMIEIVPYGIPDSPIETSSKPFRGTKVAEDDFIVLWFGGLYPWFDIRGLIRSINELHLDNPKIKLLIVGGKNPFNPNPDFARQYDEVVEYTNSKDLLNKVVFFQDWVEFNQRADWYKTADLVVSLNREGEENKFSWRTRVMDYVWAELAMATNGGDPLSELLIDKKAAYRLKSPNEADITAAIKKLSGDKAALKSLRDNLAAVKPTFFWHVITRPVAKFINSHKRALDAGRPELLALSSATPNSTGTAIPPFIKNTMPYKVARKAYRLPHYVQQHGKKAALRQIITMAKLYGRKASNKPQFLFLSHQLDNSGAPIVLMDIIEEFSRKVPSDQIRVVTFPPVAKENIRKLREMGVEVNVLPHGYVDLGIKHDDFVLMNTMAIPPVYRDRILHLLELGKLERAFWYIHEDEPDLHFDEALERRMRNLMKDSKLRILIPGKKAALNYQKYFDVPNAVQLFNYRFSLPSEYAVERKPEDFDKLIFHITGTASDGRKGQMSALMAFQKLVNTFPLESDDYRRFEVHYNGLDTDFISRQIIKVGPQILGERFKYKLKISRQEALAEIRNSNVVICYSLRECLPAYVLEGMYMGQVVLRNDCSGVDEQLIEGENGYLLDSNDINKVADVFERVLNRKKTRNDDLARMGKKSQEMVKPLEQIDTYKALFPVE